MKTIYGVRLCKVCKGILHGIVWRDKYGQRKSYYCDIHTPFVPFIISCLSEEVFEKVRVITR